MSEEFPAKTRKIGKNEMEPVAIDVSGRAAYRFNVNLKDNEIKRTYSALKKYFKSLGYELPLRTDAPAVMIPSIGKMFVTIIGEEGVSVYPPDLKYEVKNDKERSEFKKFLKDFESFFESL